MEYIKEPNPSSETEEMLVTRGWGRGVAREREGADQKVPGLIYTGHTSSGGILPAMVTLIFYLYQGDFISNLLIS